MNKVMDVNKFQFPQVAKWVVSILIVALVFYLVWYFRFIVGCIIIALILAFMGAPIQSFLSKLHIGKFRIGKTLSASITLAVIIGVFSGLFYFLVPLIIKQAMAFADLDIYKIADYYAEPIGKIDKFLYEYQLLPDDKNLSAILSGEIMKMFNSIKLTNMADVILSAGSSFVMGTFIVLFITFFFLKDNNLVGKFINAVTPDVYLEEVKNVVSTSRSLISRYFLGIFFEILIMIILLSTGFYLVGIHNYILIAFVCGVMVILPYIGVLIGGAIGLLICLTSFLSIDASLDIVPVIVKFVSVFACVKLIDDFVLQPLIYSKSVKAHPLEIFIVILASGEVGGVLGMIFAIPLYTLFRIIAKEFFNKWKFIKKLTANI